MSDSKHDRLRFLFDRALDYTGSKRTDFLERECRDDAELKARVEALLAATEDERFLTAPTGPAPKETAPIFEGPGTRIGPYKLLQMIGEGGFGAVFMAEQEKPVARRVALKIIKLGMDTRQVVARFEQERQALAVMDHPNIARVIDAGATDTGRPYFVMELVKGEPISEYCDKHNLPITERLALFEQVCNAVQHAHSKGIIHRDLKPSNILVGTQDGKPHAKIIDFGIAKATSAKLTDKTLFTEHRQIIGTLQYMSPEQAEGSLDIDTRTDVYALGVVLYELLTGSTPFDSDTLRDAMYSEIQRMIREVEPPNPSARLHQSSDTLANVAARRRVEPKRLGTLVRGELDWIVMKALEKDRSRRYETATGLGEDVRRYLAGEAVVAAPPSAAYRFRKFVRRNKATVVAGSAVSLALLVGVIAFAWQASIARSERDNAVKAQAAEAEQRKIADEQRAEAVKQQGLAEANAAAETKARKRAETTTSFVTDALRSSDPNYGGEQGITVAEAMQQAVKLLDDGAFIEEPDLDAGLRKMIADIFNRNGRIADALPLAEHALATFEASAKGDSKDVAAALNQVATIHQNLGHLDAAEPLFVRGLEMQRRLHPGDSDEVSMALNNLALVRAYLGRLEEAEPLFAESLAMKQRRVAGDNEEIAMGLNNLATILDDLGRRTEAVALYEQSLAMYERLFDDHPQVAMALYNLGQARISESRLEEADALLSRALEMYHRLFQGDHPDVARALNGVANIRKLRGRFAEAEPLLTEALEMKQRLFPGDHPQVALGLESLSRLYKTMGDLQRAETFEARALEMQERLYPNDHPDVARALDLLAGVRQDLDRPAEAEPLLVRALAMQRRLHAGDHADVARAMNRLASVLRDQDRNAEAELSSRAALEMLRRVYPGDHSVVAGAMAVLGRTLLAADRAAEAEALFRDAVEMDRRYYKGEHYDIAIGLTYLAGAQHALGKTDDERASFAESIAIHRRRTPTGSPDLADVLWRSGRARLADGDAAAALTELEEAVAMAERLLASSSPDLVDYRKTLDECRKALGR
ncbi:MAG: serine/threonine-protein kinase [Planctomycetes bacterium]|nr:serine/threonine-protein kinase [Planctomycetota bacterium]